MIIPTINRAIKSPVNRAIFHGGNTQQPPLWTPLNMAVTPPIYLHAQNSVVTDVGGACSTISNLGSLGSDGDFSQATAGNRPLTIANELNGNRVLRFDGTDDVLTCNTIAARNIFNGAPAAWCFAVYKKRTTDGSGTSRFIFYSSIGGGTASRFVHAAGSISAANTRSLTARRQDGGSSQSLAAPASSTGVYVMSSAAARADTGLGVLRLNGQVDASNASFFDTGTFSDTTSQIALCLGGYVTGTLAADIDLAALIVLNAYPSAADIDRVEGWAAHEFGLAANLPVDHPYKSSPPYQ